MKRSKRDYTLALARLLGCLLAGVLCMFAFTLSPQGYVGISDPPLRAGSAVWVLYALLLAGVFWLATGRRAARWSPGMVAMGLFFGVLNYFATTLFAYDSWSFLNTARAWNIAVLCMLGQSAVMAAALAVLCGWLEGVKGVRRHDTAAACAQGGAAAAPAAMPPKPARRFNRLWHSVCARFPRATGWARRHPVAVGTAALLMCWSPYLAAFYPGTVIWDMGEMIGQLYGLRDMSTWHPVFTTWLFGGCVWLGRQMSGDNLGVWLFTLLQTLALAYALASVIRFLGRLGLSRAWRLAVLAFFACTPIFAAFAQAVGKDTLYTAVLLLFALRTAEALCFGLYGRRQLWGYALWALFSCLVRTNGLYVVLGTAVVTVAFGLRGRQRLTVGCALAGALALALAFTHVLLPALHIKDTTASGLYSVCFQQSARTLRDHALTVTPEEYAEIDRVLDAKNLATLYESNISDPVKYTFRQYGQGRAVETAALVRYRQTWLAMLYKYPLTYLESLISGASGYYAFTPKIDAARTFNYQGGIRFVFETYALGEDARYLHTTQPAVFARAREVLAAYARGWRRVPLLELTLFCPTYTWLLMAAGLSMARRRRLRELIAFMPALLSFGVCLLSPVNDYFRYFLPVVVMCPMLLGLACHVEPERLPVQKSWDSKGTKFLWWGLGQRPNELNGEAAKPNGNAAEGGEQAKPQTRKG